MSNTTQYDLEIDETANTINSVSNLDNTKTNDIAIAQDNEDFEEDVTGDLKGIVDENPNRIKVEKTILYKDNAVKNE